MSLIQPWDEYNQQLVANVHPLDWVNPVPAGRYNLVVVGGGSAGLVAAVGAANLGAKVALVEKHLLGGDCLNVGCVPSKSVIRAARAVADIRQAEQFGVRLPEDALAQMGVDFGAIMKRMRRIRADISVHDSARRFADLGIDVFLGTGTFRSPDSIEVVDGAGRSARLVFHKALIATGSRAAVPQIPGLDTAGYLANETLFELTDLPGRMAILGGGPIGVEMAQAFNRLGSRVTVMDRGDRIMRRDDPDAAQVVAQALRREGVEILLNAGVKRVEKTPTGKIVVVESGGETRRIEVDAILIATGRMPNIEMLGLETAQVQLQNGAIVVDDYLKTTNPNIFAAGDVGYQFQFTHVADFTARVVLQNALFPVLKRRASGLIVPWATYTDPEVAHVGLTPAAASAAGIRIDTFTQPIGETDRGRADGDDEGFVRVHVRKGRDTIVGATIVARHGGEMINELTLAIQKGVGLKTLAGVIHPYPTQAEAIRKVGDLYNRTRLSPLVKGVLKWWMGRSR